MYYINPPLRTLLLSTRQVPSLTTSSFVLYPLHKVIFNINSNINIVILIFFVCITTVSGTQTRGNRTPQSMMNTLDEPVSETIVSCL